MKVLIAVSSERVKRNSASFSVPLSATRLTLVSADTQTAANRNARGSSDVPRAGVMTQANP